MRHRECRSRAIRGSPIKSRAEWTLRFANTVFRRTPSANWSATLRNTAVIPQLSMLAVVVLVSTLLFARGAPDLKAVLPVAAFAALFLTYVAFVSPKRLHRRLSRLWDTYVLEIGSDHLLRQGDTPDVQLSFAEIRSIERRPGHGLRVIGKTRYQVIGIPESIEQFEEILDLVTPLAPVTPPPADRHLPRQHNYGAGLRGLHGDALVQLALDRLPARPRSQP